MNEEQIEDLKAGDTWEFEVLVEKLKADGSYEPEDLTGCKIYLALQADVDQTDASAAVKLAYEVPAGEPATNGIALVRVESNQTNIPDRVYWLGVRRWRPMGANPPDVYTVRRQKVRVVNSLPKDLT